VLCGQLGKVGEGGPGGRVHTNIAKKIITNLCLKRKSRGAAKKLGGPQASVGYADIWPEKTEDPLQIGGAERGVTGKQNGPTKNMPPNRKEAGSNDKARGNTSKNWAIKTT